MSPPLLPPSPNTETLRVSDPDAELRVCFQFRVIPGTRRSFSKNRQRGEEMWRRERERGWKEEGWVVNEHQMPYLRW